MWPAHDKFIKKTHSYEPLEKIPLIATSVSRCAVIQQWDFCRIDLRSTYKYSSISYKKLVAVAHALLTRCTGTRPAFAAETMSSTRDCLARPPGRSVCLVAANVRNALTSANWDLNYQHQCRSETEETYIKEALIERLVVPRISFRYGSCSDSQTWYIFRE